jgi:UDP-N-acetylmuramoylalanine--D-glutamate ligase
VHTEGAAVPGRPALPEGPFLVLGLARSGEAVARALVARGEQVIGADAGGPEKPGLSEVAQRLQELGVEVHLGASDDRLAASARVLVKSPGVPQSSPLVAAFRARGRIVMGELELAWRLLPNDFIAVTGTNGKTTTTEWIGHVHRTAGVPVAVAGNVGTALSTLIGELDPAATIVCESSSFQLEDTVAFAPQSALLLNITPDHLDRHGSFEAYREAKLKVFTNQTSEATAVLPDEMDVKIGGSARVVRFGQRPGSALTLEQGQLIWRGQRLMSADDLRLPGAHNLQNAMATATVCLERGLAPQAVAEGLRSFRGVPHRLELVVEVDGVSYVNDSKATNVASTEVALNSYASGVHLILGGQGKSQDFTPLRPGVAERCAAVYLIGEDGPGIGAAIADSGVRLVASGTLEAAVRDASQAARPGEVVLLSPACASFDQFKNFEVRGDAFRAIVASVTGAEPTV